jgi:hypothetical protein
MGFTPKPESLANLRKWTPEGARLGQRKAVESRMLNKEYQTNFKRQAKAFQKVLSDIPDMSAIDVIRMCIHIALQENNYEDAARWAKELAEYEKPKLQRVDQTITSRTAEMSDEELFKIARQEGLLDDGIKLQ